MRTRAIIIKKQHVGEYDQMVTCYTEEFGKLAAVAKSILKPHSTQALQLDAMNLADFDLIEGRAAPIIAGAQAERAYPGIRASLPRLAAAGFFLEVLDKIVYDRERDGALWKFMTGVLDELDRLPPGALVLPPFRRRQAELLHIMGYTQPASAAVAHTASHSPLDGVFEQTAQAQFNSLRFLYGMLSSVIE